jgi:hypothetical protein
MKRFITHSALLFLLLSLQNIAFAATTYPYSPSEALENFESAYGARYDTINSDLGSVVAKASAWSPTAVLQNFTIGWADGTENGYSFTFIDVNNADKALDFHPAFEQGFESAEIDRTPEMAYGIFRVPMRLRDLIPAMKADEKLLPFLDSVVAEGCNTSIRITLQKTLTDRLVWRIEFRSASDVTANEAPAVTCPGYIVSVSAAKPIDPIFSIRHLNH